MAGGGTSTGTAATLNLKQVALRLGVHYMTAYRYVRQGRLAARKVGTGWLVDEADLVTFEAERDDLPETNDGGERPAVDWAERVRPHLVMGREVEAWTAVDQALAAGVTPQRAYLDLIAGSVATVGAQVEAGEATMADQHIATVTAQRLAVRLGTRFRRRRRSRGTVILGAPTGELHSLPIAIVADLLRLEAYDVLELGADVPAEAFAVAAERADAPVVVGIGVTRVEHLDAVSEIVAAVRLVDSAIPVMVGGQAVRSAEVAAVLGVDAWAPDGESVIDAVNRLIGAAKVREPDAP